MNFNFKKLFDGKSLYESKSNSRDWAVGLYYLMLAPADRPAEIDFDAAWRNRSGVYFFLPSNQQITDPDGFMAALMKLLQNPHFQSQWIAWIPSAAPKDVTAANVRLIALVKPQGAIRDGRVTGETTLKFGNLEFVIPNQAHVAADLFKPSALFTLLPDQAAGGTFKFKQTGTSRVLDLQPADTLFNVPLDSASLGTWQFAISPNRGAFYRLFQDPNDNDAAPSAEVRMTYESGLPGKLRYPVLLGALEDPQNPPAGLLPITVSLDVLSPADFRRTRMAFDLPAYVPGGPELPLSYSLRTTGGIEIGLTPLETAGFGLARRPGSNPDVAYLYLAPAGPFEAQSHPDKASAAADPVANNPLLVMCGLSSVEFLMAAEQDRLEFLGEYAANARTFGISSPPSKNALDNKYSAAWVRLIPGPKSGETFKGFIKQSYCVQAPDAVYFSSGSNSPFPFPTALGARLGDLADTSKSPIFPMAPYGWVYYSDPDRDIKNPNPDASGDLLRDFEQQAIAVQRRQSINVDQCLGPLFFDMVNLAPLNGGFVQTSRGLLVELNDGPFTGDQPAGSWKRLILTRSPNDPAQIVQFLASTDAKTHRCTGPQPIFNVVSPLLSTALMSNAPFLVATLPEPLGPFDNQVQLGEYPFVLSVNGKDSGPSLGKNTVLLFKLATDRSVKDWAADPQSWTDADVFVDAGTATRLSGQIGQFIAEAKALSEEAKKQGAYDYFANFLEVVESTSWSGVLVLNPPLDVQKLPADIQALLGGMKPGVPLRGHHFGIALNQVRKDATGGDVPIGQTSLFGLVHYDEPFVPPTSDYDFQVLKLNALFTNSSLVHFDSRIAWSTRILFGDPVKMIRGGQNDKPETNTIVIDGALQSHDGKTSIVFATTETRVFEFGPAAQRAIGQMAVFSAALQPVDSQKSGATTIVNSAFVYNGSLGFNTGTPKDTAADLFSFALDPDNRTSGMQYTAYDFSVVTTITGESASPARIALNLGGLQVAVSQTTPRAESLFATLPLQLMKFRRDVTVSSSTGSRLVTGTGLDNVTALTYAFELQMQMGTLGALSTQSPLQGSLLLGWNPGDAAADQVGMIFVPPTELANSGGFKLQGVFNTQYSSVKLNRPELTNKEGSIHVFTLSLTPVDFSIFGLPLIPLGAIRSITFFGSFESIGSESGTNLAWFVGKPLQSASDESTEIVRAADGPSLIVVPFIGVLAGLKPAIDAQATQVVGDAIDVLNEIPLDTQTTLNEIYNETAELPVTYDPTAGVTVWVDLEFPNITFKAIFSDPAIYGGRIEIADPDEEAKGLWKAIGGLVVEIAYRKISDELGAWSAFLTLPEKFRKIKFNENLTLYLPSVGVIVYTNNDWRVDVGWPFSRDTALRLDFTIEGIPFTAGIGFYLAKLRSADDPEAFGDDFAVIWRFGVGLMFGLNKEWEKGPLSLAAGIYGFVTFEGFLASETGELTQYGVDYYWFAGQLGVVAYLEGELDFKIISASLSFEAKIVVGMAVETNHRTALVVVASVSVELSIKIIFVRITFSFEATFELVNWSFGDKSLPEAKTDGPTPTAVPAPLRARLAGVEKELHPRCLHATGMLRAAAAEQTNINLYFTLQPTAIAANGASAPQAIASLLIELLPNSPDIDDFATVVQGVADWLYQKFAGAAPLKDQLNRLLLAIDSGAFEATLVDCLSSSFKFHLLPATGNLDGDHGAIFPIFPQLQMSYNGKPIPFYEPVVPDDYAHNLSVYFSQLAKRVGSRNGKSLATLSAAGLPQSPAGIVFGDLFNVMGKQLVSQMQDLADADPALTFQQALADLGPAGYQNIAGAVTRYAQYGLRLPTPDSHPFGKEVAAIFALTGQQQPLVQKDGIWNTTFELSYGSIDVEKWIVLGDGTGTSIKETLNPNLVLTEKIDPAWLTTGGGFQPLAPIRPSQLEYYLGGQLGWQQPDGKIRQMRPFSGALQQYVAANAPLIATVRLVDQQSVSADGTLPGDIQNAAAGLFIGLQLAPIPGENGLPIKGVYRLIGTDDFTRNQIEDIVSTAAVNSATLHFLAPLGNSNYRSSVNDSSIVLAKTNLSTLTAPPSARLLRTAAAAPPAPPSSAKLSDVSNFLWLTWEVSVVHSGGYFLYAADLPDTAFQSGVADIAVLVTFGASSAAPRLEQYHNTFVFDGVPDRNKTVSVGISDTSQKPVVVYQQNYDAGAVGFEIVWPNAPVDSELGEKPTPEQKEAFLVALYSILQYRVGAIQAGARALAQTPELPSHWSLPIGPRGTSDWTFSRTLAVAAFLGEDNRFTPIGMNVSFDITLLDVYGNALPAEHTKLLEVVYNDPLAPLGEWPWMSSSYTFRKDAGNQALLTVVLQLNPLIADEGDPDAQKRTIADAAEKYRLIGNQVADQNASASISSTLFANAFTVDRNGRPVVSVFAQYITGTVLPYIATLTAPPYPPPPAPLALEFIVDRSYVTTIADDIFELSVETNIWRKESAVKPDIRKNMPTVQRVTSPLAPMPNPPQSRSAAGPADDNDTTLRAFAKEFETAWAGFDGKPSSTALLKVCEGAQAATADPGEPNRQFWAVRVGKGAGISAEFPNAGSKPPLDAQPVYFSPIPLSTQLLTGTFQVRVYDTTGIQDIDHTFSGIDLDVWARSFLLTYESVLGPEMSTATATLDSAIFADYLSKKEDLARQIQNGLQAVLDIPGVTPDPKQPRDRFFQALLNSLSADYTVASVVGIGADVTVARKTEPPIPPNLYGDVSADTIRKDQAVSLTPAKLATRPGRVNMPYVVSTTQPADQAFLDITPSYKIGFIEHDFQPDRQRFGYVPSSWITFIDPVFNPAGGASPLSPPMGRNQIPIPLRAYPDIPALPSQAATPNAPRTIQDALQWTYSLNIAEQSSPQDSLTFRLIFNEPAKSSGGSTVAAKQMPLAAGPGGDPPRRDPDNLFEALARFTFEYPEIAPDLAKVPEAAFEGKDVDAARTALQRFQYLVKGVDQTWEKWSTTLHESRQRQVARSVASDGGPLPEENWVYTVEFKELPRLVVTRAIEHSSVLPPWPKIDGFTSPSSAGPEGTYDPIPGAVGSAGLQITVPGLFLVTRESVRANAYVERNSNLVPDDAPPGTRVNRKFVYTTPVVELTDSVIPLQDAPDPIVMPEKPSLGQAITALFEPFTTSAGVPQDKVEELRFEIGISYRYRIVHGDSPEQSLYTTIPVFLVQEDASVGSQPRPGTTPLDTIEKEITSSLATWHKTVQPSGEDASLDLEFTLFALMGDTHLPSARFRSIVIPVPEDDPQWWR